MHAALFRLRNKTSVFSNIEQSLNPNLTESLQKDILILSAEKMKPGKTAGEWTNGSDASDRGHNLTSPIPLPAFPANASPGRGLYYV